MATISDGLIVGAGPTGLTLGCELIRRGMSVALCEQTDNFSPYSRALGLHARTLELFEKMGIIDRFLAEGLQIKRICVHQSGKTLASVDFSRLDAPYPFVLILPQTQTEQILADHFTRLGGTIQSSTKLQSLTPTGGIFIKEGEAPLAYEAPWIFGCDGAHSTVRKALHLPFTGVDFSETYALADVSLSGDLAHDEMHIFSSSEKTVLFFPLPKINHFRIVTLVASKKLLTPPLLDLSFFQSLVDTHCRGRKIDLNEILWASLFSIHRRIAPTMRVGNTFLLGDAAHIHSPAGGQGLNTCVQDAYNLAWKIALVHKKKSSGLLLDSYEAERHPVALDILKESTRMTRVMLSSKIRPILIPIVIRLMHRPKIQRLFLTKMSQIGMRYRKSPILVEPWRNLFWKGPKAGERAPDVSFLIEGKRLFHFLMHTRYTLLCFGAEECVPLIDMIRREFPDEIITCTVGSIADKKPTIYDPKKRVVEKYHAQIPCIYLIRPDGVIAYRSRDLSCSLFLKSLKRQLLGSSL